MKLLTLFGHCLLKNSLYLSPVVAMMVGVQVGRMLRISP